MERSTVHNMVQWLVQIESASTNASPLFLDLEADRAFTMRARQLPYVLALQEPELAHRDELTARA